MNETVMDYGTEEDLNKEKDIQFEWEDVTLKRTLMKVVKRNCAI